MCLKAYEWLQASPILGEAVSQSQASECMRAKENLDFYDNNKKKLSTVLLKDWFFFEAPLQIRVLIILFLPPIYIVFGPGEVSISLKCFCQVRVPSL